MTGGDGVWTVWDGVWMVPAAQPAAEENFGNRHS